MAARTVATGASNTRIIEVRRGGDLVGSVTLGVDRRALSADGGWLAGPANNDDTQHGPAAWTTTSADRAAAARWGQRHRTLLTASRLDAATATDAALTLDQAALHLRDTEVRRIDVGLTDPDPLVGHLSGPMWMRGRVGSTVVASRAVAYPWTQPQPDPAWMERLGMPLGARRALRRGRSALATPWAEVAATTGQEVAGAIRSRQLPRRNQHLPVAGAPEGAHPFAASRRRTVEQAMELVPPELHQTRFVDIGAGDGRVLQQALDLGFNAVLGRELDPELGGRARRAIGNAGTVEIGDALQDPLPDDTGVVFLNNPFDRRGVADLAGLVAASMDRCPRPILVIFLNPASVAPLVACGLELVEANPNFSILAGGSER